jgi:glutamate-1-semialdehyde aminotransferase
MTLEDGLVIDRSDEIYARAKEIIPGGSQTFSKGVTQFVEGFAPKYLARGKGCRVWDPDGNEFIDYIMANQPLVLGYADPDVNAAVVEQLELGSTFSLMNELEVDVTELLIDNVPCAEAARFGKNGADATTVGVRIARAVTGREHLAYSGYHGWHDWYIANTDLNSGIPKFNQELGHSFSYNDLDSLQAIFDAHPDEIACVIMEPLAVLEPKDNFLQKVKDMAHQYGALLIFDEVITGFRFAMGGAQELTGVTPDLACLAKGISNGIPLSAIVGKKEYMWALEKTFFSFTYGGDCVGLSAAKACIPKLKREKVPDHLNEIGIVLKEGFNNLAVQYGVDEFVQCIGYPCRSIIAMDGKGRFDNLELKSYLQQELMRRGVMWAAYHSLSWSHKLADIHETLNAYDDALRLLSHAVRSDRSLRSFIEGIPVRPVFRKVSDFNSYIQQGGEAEK